MKGAAESRWGMTLALLLGGLGACVGQASGPGGNPVDSPGLPGAAPPGSATQPGLAPNPGGGGIPSAGVPPGAPIGDGDFLPTRIRRLTNAEYDSTVSALLGQSSSHGNASFAPDIRQRDFTQNAGARVDPVFAGQLQAAAAELSKSALANLVTGLGCSSGDPCAQQFIASFASRAFRRPVSDEEKKDLFAVYQAGASGTSFADGLQLVVQAVLESASFLYLTELGGAPPRNGLVSLAPYETAASLSYLVTGGPPDPILLEAAAAGRLAVGSEREAQARRLLGANGSKAQVQRLIEEWLSIDRLEEIGKDNAVYPKFDSLRPAMAAETAAFIAETVFNDDASLAKLLGADYTTADRDLARFYGLERAPAGSRLSLVGSPRRGILTQASYLSVHASEGESAPVRRGVNILEKLLCVELPSPAELNIMVVPPRPDPTLTTRERFQVHSRDPACAQCHALIDPIGFAFEAFDGMGGYRTTENKKPVDTSGNIAAGGLMASVKDAADLVAKLAESEDVARCFGRNVFRFAGADGGQSYEDKFLKSVWLPLPPARRGNIKKLLAAYAASDAFVTRKVSP